MVGLETGHHIEVVVTERELIVRIDVPVVVIALGIGVCQFRIRVGGNGVTVNIMLDEREIQELTVAVHDPGIELEMGFPILDRFKNEGGLL